jgi:hypothetical protein
MGADWAEHMARLLSVYDGRDCAGFLIRRPRRGVEPFDREENSLGIFPSEVEAANAVLASASNERGAG